MGAEREQPAGQPEGRRHGQGRGQEHHRIRRLRRSGRHRWPAAHHRSGLAPRQASVRSGHRGDEVSAVVLKFDQEKNRVSLGLKQLGEDPWVGLSRRYPTGTRMFGKVANLTDYGCFVEIEPGIEGLVHVSEMDWTNKNVNPSKMVSLGDEVEVMVLEIDEDRRRISLGMKQCKSNPWDDFAMNYKKGDKVARPDQVHHRLRRLHRPERRHRRSGAPVRPVLEPARRGSPAQLPQGRGSGSRGAGHRRGEGAHLPGRQADGERSVQRLRGHP
jgi:predicted RNA-binding protein with RPS1 domain